MCTIHILGNCYEEMNEDTCNLRQVVTLSNLKQVVTVGINQFHFFVSHVSH